MDIIHRIIKQKRLITMLLQKTDGQLRYGVYGKRFLSVVVECTFLCRRIAVRMTASMFRCRIQYLLKRSELIAPDQVTIVFLGKLPFFEIIAYMIRASFLVICFFFHSVVFMIIWLL